MPGNAEFSELSKKNYKGQAIWFLNGFWGNGVTHEEAMKIWDYKNHFVKLDFLSDAKKGEQGNELDQFWSAKFLEDKDAAMPAQARKDALRTIDQDSNGKMSLLEYLVWKYKKGVEETAKSPQGSNVEALKAAQQKLDTVQAQLTDCETKLQAQKAAKAEVDKALAELHQQQKEYDDKIADLEKKSQEGTIVQKNKAANELAQLKQSDPLPLRKAKLTTEAAQRKLDKAIAELETAYQSLEKALAEASAELDRLKKQEGGGKGAIWWMQRELFEADALLPKSKQKFDHSKPFSNPF